MPIVRYHDHGAFTLVQDTSQPADTMDIQIVGGLIQQQDIRIRKQRLGQQHSELPTRRHLTHQQIMQRFINASLEQNLTRTALCGVAIEFGEDGLELGDFHAICFTHFWQVVDPVTFAFDLP